MIVFINFMYLIAYRRRMSFKSGRGDVGLAMNVSYTLVFVMLSMFSLVILRIVDIYAFPLSAMASNLWPHEINISRGLSSKGAPAILVAIPIGILLTLMVLGGVERVKNSMAKIESQYHMPKFEIFWFICPYVSIIVLGVIGYGAGPIGVLYITATILSIFAAGRLAMTIFLKKAN